MTVEAEVQGSVLIIGRRMDLIGAVFRLDIGRSRHRGVDPPLHLDPKDGGRAWLAAHDPGRHRCADGGAGQLFVIDPDPGVDTANPVDEEDSFWGEPSGYQRPSLVEGELDGGIDGLIGWFQRGVISRDAVGRVP